MKGSLAMTECVKHNIGATFLCNGCFKIHVYPEYTV